MEGKVDSNTPKTKKRGRPALPDDEKKKHRTIKLSDKVWDELETIGGGRRARAIEEVLELYWTDLREKYGKK